MSIFNENNNYDITTHKDYEECRLRMLDLLTISPPTIIDYIKLTKDNK